MKGPQQFISIFFSTLIATFLLSPLAMAQVSSFDPKSRNYQYETVLDSYAVQSRVNYLNGSTLFVDEDNKVVASKNANYAMEPASTSKLITALAFLKYYPANTKLPQFRNKTSFQVVKYMLDVSDNGLADRLANMVGLNNVQSLARQVTGNEKINIANGSGCPRGLYGEDCEMQSNRPTTYTTAYDMIAIVKSLETLLVQQGTSFEALVGNVLTSGTSGHRRFYEDFVNSKTARVYGKTGTIRSSLSFVGIMYNQSGKKIYFAMLNTGNHQTIGDTQGSVLVAAHKGVKRLVKKF